MMTVRGFRERIPNFVEGIEPVDTTFSTLEELLAHPGDDLFRDFTHFGPFARFSLSGEESQPALMAEYDNGYRWLVVGFIGNAEGLDLPEWKPPARFGG